MVAVVFLALVILALVSIALWLGDANPPDEDGFS
jgi:hypothetical protein